MLKLMRFQEKNIINTDMYQYFLLKTDTDLFKRFHRPREATLRTLKMIKKKTSKIIILLNINIIMMATMLLLMIQIFSLCWKKCELHICTGLKVHRVKAILLISCLWNVLYCPFCGEWDKWLTFSEKKYLLKFKII